MGNELAITSHGQVVHPNGNAVRPAAPHLPDHLGGANPTAGNSASREVAKPAGAAVVRNLSRASWLDLLNRQMFLLNQDLDRIGAQLDSFAKIAETLDATISNMEELGKLYEAPEATRSALDADATVSSLIVDLVRRAGMLAHQTQEYNAQGFIGLRTMNSAQESQRAQGAGPKLLQTAGRS